MLQTDIGNWARGVSLAPSTGPFSKSSDDVTEIVGRIVDRLILDRLSSAAPSAAAINPAVPYRAYMTAKVLIPWAGTFASTVGIRIVGRMLHATSTAAGDFTAFGSTSITRTYLATTTATSTSHVGVAEFNYDLRTARRFLQFNYAPAILASSSGSLNFHPVMVLGGADELPSGIVGAAMSTAALTATALPLSATS